MRTETDFYPCPKRADFLVAGLRKKLAGSLSYLLEFASVNHKIEPTKAQSKINQISNAPNVSGYLFALNKKLLDSLQNNDKQTVQEIIDEIATGNYIFSDFSFTNFPTETRQKTWLSEVVCFEENCYPGPVRCEEDQYQITKKGLEKAFQVLKDVDPELHGEIFSLASEALIFDSKVMRTGSSFDLYGSIYYSQLRPHNDWLKFLEDTVHEAAHLYLFSFVGDDALVLNKFEKLYNIHFRDDKRALVGVYHGTFVLARILYFFDKLIKSGHPSIKGREDNLRELLAGWKQSFSDGLQVIERDGVLTPFAKDLMLDTKEKISLID
ncbi:MAG: HEXXH motif-containing putative peptide modification protein [Alphaproteobacteria bacterium]